MLSTKKTMEYFRPQDRYDVFVLEIKECFERVIANLQTKKLYRAKVEPQELWDLYLSNLPEEGRFVYDCRACKHFIERYGNLVTIADDGHVESALWYICDVPEYFKESVRRMNNYIRNTNKVIGVFESDVKVLGTPITGVWTHLHVELPKEMVNRSRTKNAEQLMAEKREDFRILLDAIQEYPKNVVEQAIELLKTDSMYRGERILGVAEWFLNVHKSIEGVTGNKRTNLIWKAVGEAPNGFCHVKSSVIGTLLDDIVAGLSTRVIIARFEEKMNPQNYMRSQSAPTASAIAQAERLVEKLGIADSLRRRYARFDEVYGRCMWTREMNKYVKAPLKDPNAKSAGVFANVAAKDRTPSNDITLDMPMTTMTWAKFAKTILPTAEKLEVKVDNPNRFMAMVTEAVPGSENILQWDNSFSWYYHGGIDGEMKRRVEAAGGMYEDCVIRCSLMWDSYTDLDLHCRTPRGTHIYFGDKHEHITGGYLDVDANGGRPTTTSPVENMRWANIASSGHYQFWVHNYQDRNSRNNPYKVELEVGGKVYSCEGFLRGTGGKELAFEFDYRDGVVTNMRTGYPVSSSNSEMWNLTMNQFAEVKGIVKSPNMWTRNDIYDEHADNNHTFFILDGCKDTSEGRGRGFFNEILKPELREIRKTLEAYTASTPIDEAETADACGVGYTSGSEWNLILRVNANCNCRLIKIDRFD